MSCAQTDIKISNIKLEIASKKKELMRKRKYLENLATGNEFLNGVVNDYKNYYNYIIKQKQEQHDTLAGISEYLGRLSETLKKTDNILDNTKHDQTTILNQMNIIKKDIENLTNE